MRNGQRVKSVQASKMKTAGAGFSPTDYVLMAHRTMVLTYVHAFDYTMQQ